MKRNLMIGMCMVLGMALSSEARDWGFSKDTVYEWNSGGDTVWLVNSTADALVLNSVIAIDVDTSMWSDTWFNYHPSGADPYLLVVTQEPEQYRTLQIPEGRRLLPSGESAIFRNFVVGPPPIASKGTNASRSQPGDTIKMGIRILTEGGEEDTVIVVGIFDYGTSLSPRPPVLLKRAPIILDRDLRGRRVEPSRTIPMLKR